MPGPVLEILCAFSYLNFSIALQGRVYCLPLKMGKHRLSPGEVTEERFMVPAV